MKKSYSKELRKKVIPPVRLTEREYSWILQRAREENVTLSEYIRSLLLADLYEENT